MRSHPGTTRLDSLRWSVNTLARSAVTALAFERAMHSWWTWLFLWLGRILAEISFYALIGRLVGDRQAVELLLVGAAILGSAYSALPVSSAVKSMMQDGLVPYLISAPAPVFTAALGRSLHWCIDGVVAGTIGLVVGARIFDLDLTGGQVAALVGLVALCPATMLGLALCLGSLATRVPEGSYLLAALTRGLIGLLSGGLFPTSHLPPVVAAIGQLLPVTHVVTAARAVQAGDPTAAHLAAAVATGLAWIALARWLVQGQFDRSRRTGNFL